MLKSACSNFTTFGVNLDGRLYVHADGHRVEVLLKAEGMVPIVGKARVQT